MLSHTVGTIMWIDIYVWASWNVQLVFIIALLFLICYCLCNDDDDDAGFTGGQQTNKLDLYRNCICPVHR